jgi:hypothetical protein
MPALHFAEVGVLADSAGDPVHRRARPPGFGIECGHGEPGHLDAGLVVEAPVSGHVRLRSLRLAEVETRAPPNQFGEGLQVRHKRKTPPFEQHGWSVPVDGVAMRCARALVTVVRGDCPRDDEPKGRDRGDGY